MLAVHPSLSVVVLTCNRPRDLELSIRSVVTQDLRPSELILVDVDVQLTPHQMTEAPSPASCARS